MPQSYKAHGSWSRYEPAEIPPEKPINTMFLKRDTDGVDWYTYAHDPKNFTDGSVKLVIQKWVDTYVVNAGSTDPTFLFPQGAIVLEVIGFEGDPSQFNGKIVDPATDTFTDPPAPPAITQKADIWRRCTDSEADTLSNLLAALPARKRNLYNDALYLSHADPFYAELYAAVAQAITPARADVVLAAS
jgi:hypothetical protein